MVNGIGPGPASEAPGRAGGLAIVQNAETIARLYRRLVILVGIQLLVGGYVQVLSASGASASGPGFLALIASLVLIGTFFALPVTAYQLTSQMREGRRSPILWAVLMILPCVNILSLLILSTRAQTWCQRHGVKVGLFGPTRESIEELRRRVMTSPFD
jgi:hypothetical protein